MTDAAFWDRAAPKYARDPIADPAGYEETLGRMRHLLQPDHRVLELGCGTGSTALELAPGVGRYLGTDISAGMIEIAKGKLAGLDLPGLTFATAPAGAMPKGPFDAVLALNLLHLVEDVEGIAEQVFRALPPGGLFIAKTALLREGGWYLRPMIGLMRAIGKAPYVRMLDRAELTGILTGVGFQLDDTLVQPGMAPRVFTVARKP